MQRRKKYQLECSNIKTTEQRPTLKQLFSFETIWPCMLTHQENIIYLCNIRSDTLKRLHNAHQGCHPYFNVHGAECFSNSNFPPFRLLNQMLKCLSQMSFVSFKATHRSLWCNLNSIQTCPSVKWKMENQTNMSKLFDVVSVIRCERSWRNLLDLLNKNSLQCFSFISQLY